jgi:hypothetical protein
MKHSTAIQDHIPKRLDDARGLGGYDRRVFFAYRRCEGLAYASQQESPTFRSISRSRKIRMQVGGSPNLFEPFPPKPRRMHWRTYNRLRARGEVADELAFSRL